MDQGILAPTIGDTLAAAARARGGATAYVDEQGRNVSWSEIDAAADRVASGLLALGFGRGDRIGLIAPNGIGWLQAFYGAARIGVAVVALSVRYRDAEIEYMLADSGARGLIAVGQAEGFDLLAMAGRIAPRLPRLSHLIPFEPTPGHAASLSSLPNNR